MNRADLHTTECSFKMIVRIRIKHSHSVALFNTMLLKSFRKSVYPLAEFSVCISVASRRDNCFELSVMRSCSIQNSVLNRFLCMLLILLTDLKTVRLSSLYLKLLRCDCAVTNDRVVGPVG